jgi:hypothetical protein
MIYLPREHRFGTTVSWTTKSNYSLSLAELLSIARNLKAHFAQPVLIVLGHWDINKYESRKKKFSYNKLFSWNRDESADFNRSTELVAEFNSARGSENYMVYTVR